MVRGNRVILTQTSGLHSKHDFSTCVLEQVYLYSFTSQPTSVSCGPVVSLPPAAASWEALDSPAEFMRGHMGAAGATSSVQLSAPLCFLHGGEESQLNASAEVLSPS